ncbi:MAG TPA: DedA family protein, partial [Thermoplasmata archaeon]|nr:DedA family protein [Thermoplasmata archaeon]
MTFSLFGSFVTLITTLLTVVGLPGLLALMAVESFGLPPIPSEVILPFAGFLVADGTLPLGGTIAFAVAGGLLGAFAAYAVGRWWRSRLAGLGVGQLRIEERDLERMDTWFARRGEITVAAARVIPGVRSYISYPAGTAKMSPVRFGLYTLVGSLPWTLALLYAGIALGSHWDVVTHYFFPIDVAIVVLVILGAAYLALVANGTLERGWPPRRKAP